MLSLSNVMFFLIMFLACIVSGLVGFGSNILALPFLSLFLDVKTIVPVLVLTVLFNGVPRLLSQYRSINLFVYFSMLPLVALGGVCGIHLANMLHEGWMKLLLALLMIFIAGKGLRDLHSQGKPQPRAKKNPLIFCIPFLGGIMQAAFRLRRSHFQYLYFTESAKERGNPRHPICHRRHLCQHHRLSISDDRHLSRTNAAFRLFAGSRSVVGLRGQRTYF